MLKFAIFTLTLFAATLPGIATADASNDEKTKRILWSENVEITKGDFLEWVENVPPENRDEFLSSPQRVTKLLEAALITKTLAHEAKKLGLDKNPDVARAMARAVEKVLAQERMKSLTQAGQPDFELKAKETYLAFPERFASPEQASASHILISTKQRSNDEAMKKAQEVRQEVISGKLSFSDAAVKYSEDPSVKKNKGDMGFFSRGRMVKPFEEAVFAMKDEGQISEPILTSFGYHIIKYQGRKEAAVRPFESVKQELIKDARDKYEGDVRKVHLSKILNDPTLQMDRDAVLSLKTNMDWDAVILDIKKDASEKEDGADKEKQGSKK